MKIDRFTLTPDQLKIEQLMPTSLLLFKILHNIGYLNTLSQNLKYTLQRKHQIGKTFTTTVPINEVKKQMEMEALNRIRNL